MNRRLLWAALSLVVLAVLLSGLEVQRRWDTPLQLPEQGHVLTVAKGDSLRSVATRLHREGVLAYPEILVAYARLRGLDASIRRGEYLLAQGILPQALLDQLVAGQVVQYHVTLPEGITVAQALTLLGSDPVLAQQLDGPEDPACCKWWHPTAQWKDCSCPKPIALSAAPVIWTFSPGPTGPCSPP
ncbi:endolytic transglycosylase MltG [Kineobactrum salinum]|uniref:endolytic transglycosylase MltG n=1 Tax=Kineobactrum salinum TaxID=2708301 RepID=UPI0022B2A1C3|nr:endolytic transglycosylase MltG [Kineobactrum salinum]